MFGLSNPWNKGSRGLQKKVFLSFKGTLTNKFFCWHVILFWARLYHLMVYLWLLLLLISLPCPLLVSVNLCLIELGSKKMRALRWVTYCQGDMFIWVHFAAGSFAWACFDARSVGGCWNCIPLRYDAGFPLLGEHEGGWLGKSMVQRTLAPKTHC